MEKSTVGNHYFCSASIRPSGCLKASSICCLHCDKTVKCFSIKHNGTKPCTLEHISYDEECQFSI